jgi:hypothetical protein
MQGKENDIGIIPKAIVDVVSKKGDKKMFISYFEIKERDTAYDLIKNNAETTIRTDGSGELVY